MLIKVFENYNALSEEAANEIVSVVKQKPDAVLCLATGDTPTLAYSLLRRRIVAEKIDISGCTFVGLDEWLEIPPQNEGSCSFYLHHHVFHPLNVKPDQIHLFDALSDDPHSECTRMDALIRQKGKIDLMLVGVGMNGHIGFNEPGVPTSLYSHVVNLDPVTQTVGQKYFTNTTRLTRGITLGLRHFFESRKAIMMANGIKKAEVVKLALEGPVSINLPASAVQHHSNAIILLDEEAARSLRK